MDANIPGPVIEIDTKYQQGKKVGGTTIPVPPDQAWLFYKLDRQEKILGGIRSWVTFLGVLVILSVIFAACSALGIH
jgi:hypothetical protein